MADGQTESGTEYETTENAAQKFAGRSKSIGQRATRMKESSSKQVVSSRKSNTDTWSNKDSKQAH